MKIQTQQISHSKSGCFKETRSYSSLSHTVNINIILFLSNEITLHRIGGGEAAAWAAWSGERTCAASVAQIRDRLSQGSPFCTSLHAVLTHFDIDDLFTNVQ